MQYLIPVAFFILVGYVFSEIARHRTAIKLIEHNNPHRKDDYRQKKYSSLKWGMVMVAIGAALLAGKSFNDLLTVSLMLIFAGIALVLYHRIRTRMP